MVDNGKCVLRMHFGIERLSDALLALPLTAHGNEWFCVQEHGDQPDRDLGWAIGRLPCLGLSE